MSDLNAWTLDGPAPEPAVFEESTEKPNESDNLATHSGTDPLGRAIGPNEDPTKVKRVLDDNGVLVDPSRRTRSRKDRTND